MCGIAGFVGQAQGGYRGALDRMLGTIAHRGPDDSDTWADESLDVALGHRRLSILDLSPAGGQPMVSPAGDG